MPTLSGIPKPNKASAMFYALNWFVVVALLALWSLAAWAVHALAIWTVSHAGALTGAASGAGAMRLPEGLAPEIMQWIAALASGLGPLVDSLLRAVPALAGGVTVVTWLVWGIVSVLLVLLGAGVHLLIALWRRRGGGSSGPDAGRPLAAG